ncbi:class I SAM-dependent methyltransferase [Allopontixanthobacter sp.]|uniref:class I SAM-dependent methyltransferase n=1 Tax=Allopontixanthobacter sp. TaxID=2906452 RepID=UPI002ABB15DD|nr:class I SAM-dependent methyltransferase [Allopontixanthobacter sp.]MDZ4308410.1 class I SAM-dependent methyltransferase [Allopontixanthobacter sp.]
MSGELTRTKASHRHPLDWYVEQGWEWDMIMRQIGTDPELADDAAIWDPCAGFGHSGSRLESWGFGRIYLSDLVENVAYDDFLIRPIYFSGDFLEQSAPPESPCSIFFNPPYSYIKGIGEAFVRHALQLATHRVVALFPIKWLSGGKVRGRLFRFDHPPQQVLYFMQRPSMPPGDLIEAMGSRAYRGGQIDYCALVWDVRRPTAPGDTRSIWLPRFDDPIEGIA